MPRETIKWGRDFAIHKVPASKDTPSYEYEVTAEAAHAHRQDGTWTADELVFDTKPHLDLVWSRPIDNLSLPLGEEAHGAVQVEIILSPADMQRRIDHISAHPEDLEAFSQFFTEPLTRGEINQFIRHLKRARDAAYGADE